MRKGLAEGSAGTMKLTLQALKNLEKNGYKYVQVKGLTIDKHYDYFVPHFIMLVPIKELPIENDKKDIYEPIGSDLLAKWALEEQEENLEILIAMNN